MPELPKMYRVVEVEFSSLRDDIGPNGGVMCDCDTMVKRRARRASTPEGWAWQIVYRDSDYEWDWCLETDIECLVDSEKDDIRWVK